MTNEKDLAQARADDPSGVLCGVCGNQNDFADDCGWFEVDGKCLCEKCWRFSGARTAER